MQDHPSPGPHKRWTKKLPVHMPTIFGKKRSTSTPESRQRSRDRADALTCKAFRPKRRKSGR